jgi:iron complex outermembrane receptor protein
LINRVTKKPYGSFGSSFTLSTGNYGFRRAAIDINSPLDPKKELLLRINSAYNYKNSFQDNAFSRYFVFDPSLTYNISDRLTLSLDAELYWGRNLTTGFIFFSPSITSISELGANRADELPTDYRRRFASRDLAQNSRNHNLFSNLNYRISNHWKSKTYVTATHSYSDGPDPFMYLLSNVEVTGNPSNKGADYVSRNDQSTLNSKDNMLEIQQNFNGNFNLGSMKNRLLVGLDYFHHNANQLFVDAAFDTVASHGTIPNYNDFNKTNLKAVYASRGPTSTFPINFISNTYSAYASDVLNITDNLLAMAALRVDYFVNEGSYHPPSETISDGYHQLTFSPKFGLVYQLFTDRLSLFANYQNGFTNQNGTNYKGKIFIPEHANQWEGGVKLDFFNGHLSSTISYYNIEVKDIIRPNPNHPHFSIQNGTQNSRGIEASITANPIRGLNLTTGFAYNDSKYKKAGPNIVGLRPATAGSPARVHWWISYRLANDFLPGLGVGFGGSYASNNKIINNRRQGVFILPSYTVLNTSLFYNYSNFRLSLKVDNLTDKHYWTGYATMNPQELRSFAGSITYKF